MFRGNCTKPVKFASGHAGSFPAAQRLYFLLASGKGYSEVGGIRCQEKRVSSPSRHVLNLRIALSYVRLEGQGERGVIGFETAVILALTLHGRQPSVFRSRGRVCSHRVRPMNRRRSGGNNVPQS